MDDFHIIGDFLVGSALLTEKDDVLYENAQLINPVPEDVSRIMNLWGEGENKSWIHGIASVRISEVALLHTAMNGYTRVESVTQHGFTFKGDATSIIEAIASVDASKEK